MKRTKENIISSFFYYMWCRWDQKECITIFGPMSEHFWSKWLTSANNTPRGAAERFYADLSTNNRQQLIQRACQLYDGSRPLSLKKLKMEKLDNSAEILEMLQYISNQLKLNEDELDLTNDEGKATVFDSEKEVYISDIMLSKDNIPCAVIPLGYFADDTIQAIVDILSL